MKVISGLHPYARLGHMESLEGARLAERKLEVAAHNMANIATTGFKRQRISFEEYILPHVDGGKRTAKGEVVTTDFAQGTLHETGNPLDFAIEGEGFFVVQTPDGIKYTRDGSFLLDANKQLVTKEGYPVLGNGAPIVLDDTTGKGIWLSEDGNFYVDETNVGALDLVRFENPQFLKRLGGNLYEATPEAGEPQNVETRVRQGFLEDSNVEPIQAMLDMITLYRYYEGMQKTLQTVDSLDNRAVNGVGKPA